jgi:hypoxanthine phosphoribosyltransferase
MTSGTGSEILAESQAVLHGADCLFSAVQVEAALDSMATDINTQFANKVPVLLGVMVGGVVPLGRLLRRFVFPLQVDYVHASRYREEISGGTLRWLKRPDIALRDRHVLIIDDVLDEGLTLQAIVEACRAEGAAEVSTAVLVDKQLQARPGLDSVDFAGLKAADRYLFGSGMDYKGYLRNVDGIYAVKER